MIAGRRGTDTSSSNKSYTGFLLLLVLAFVLYLAKSILAPFLIALLLAYACDPLVDRLEARRIPRSLAIGLILLTIVFVLLLTLFVVLPTLQDQLTRTFKQLPSYLESVQKSFFPSLEARFGIVLPGTFEETIESFLLELKEGAPALFKPVTSFAMSFFTNTFGVLVALANIVIIPFIFFYLLRDFDVMTSRLSSFVPNRWRFVVDKCVGEIDVSLSGFIRGQLLVMALLSVLYAGGLSFIGLDMSFALGFIAAAGEIVPYVGFAVGLLLSVLFALLQFQDLIHPLYVLLLFGGVQAIQGMAIAPLIMGKQVGLHPLVIVAAVYIGGDLFGFVGVLLAVPAAAIAVVFLKTAIETLQRSGFLGGKS